MPPPDLNSAMHAESERIRLPSLEKFSGSSQFRHAVASAGFSRSMIEYQAVSRLRQRVTMAWRNTPSWANPKRSAAACYGRTRRCPLRSRRDRTQLRPKCPREIRPRKASEREGRNNLANSQTLVGHILLALDLSIDRRQIVFPANLQAMTRVEHQGDRTGRETPPCYGPR